MTGLFKFPWFMGRKKKLEALEGMLKILEKSGRKKRCDICKRRFTKDMTRWSKGDLTSSICIVCHKKFWRHTNKDYMPWELPELRRLSKK